MASLFTNQTLPATSEEAIRQFDEKYLAAITAAAPPAWCAPFIDTVGHPATYPMSLMSTVQRDERTIVPFQVDG
jgi:hypothetical protein